MQFVNPYFLWALVFIAVPVIVHLFQFRRFKRVYFSNVTFLKSIQQESTNKNKIKHLLVLASRILAIAFLVIAFAQPFILSKNTAANTGRKYTAVYIDNSFSMDAIGKGVSLLEQAKSTARGIAQSYAPNDLFQLVTNDFSGKHQRLVSKEEFVAFVDEVKISPASRKWAEVQKKIADILGSENTANASAFLISDMQQNMGVIEEYGHIKFNAIPLSAQKQSNVFIDTCFFYEPTQMLNQKNKLIIRIKNSGDDDIENLRVSLTINNQSKALANPTIKAQSFAYDTLNFTISDTGWNKAVVSLDDYPITFDDKYFISFFVQNKVNVIEIKETGTGNFISVVFANQPEFSFSSLPAGNVNYALIAKAQFIVLSNQKAISSGLSDELQKFLQQGGGVLLFPNEQAEINSLNGFLASIGSGNLGVLNNEPQEGGALNIYQKTVRDLFDKIPENIQLPKVFKYYQYKNGSMPSEDIYTLKNSDKAIIACKVGNGVLYICTTPLDAKANEIVIHSLFAPLVYKMSVLSSAAQATALVIGSKNAVDVPVNTQRKEDVLKIFGEGIEFIPEQIAIGNKVQIFPKDQIKQAGFYKVGFDNANSDYIVAMNYNRMESDLKFADIEQLGNQNPNLSFINVSGMESAAIANEIGRGTALWKYCLLLVLLFLGIETALLLFWKR
jgi:hypothetical protein